MVGVTATPGRTADDPGSMSERLLTRPSAWRLADDGTPTVAATSLPFVDRDTMLAIDRLATDRIGLGLLQMMENAGFALAELARLGLGGSVERRRVTVLAGTGSNAGGGLVAARRLAGWGAEVGVILARPVLRLRPGPCAQVEPTLAAGVTMAVVEHDRSLPAVSSDVRRADVVLDALIGYSLHGAPDPTYAALIELASGSDAPVISLDLPSGVDPATGSIPGAVVAADATLALALPKLGTDAGPGRDAAGVRYLADIGIPPALYRQVGLELTLPFREGSLVRLA